MMIRILFFFCYRCDQTWVCSLVHSRANLLTPSCGEVKCSLYCRAPSKKYRKLELKSPTPQWFSVKSFQRQGEGEGQQRIRWLDGITDSMDMSLSKLGNGEGQGSLAWCSPWGHKESDMTEQLNNISCPSGGRDSSKALALCKLTVAKGIKLWLTKAVVTWYFMAFFCSLTHSSTPCRYLLVLPLILLLLSRVSHVQLCSTP